MVTKPRVPSSANLSRAGKGMHSKNKGERKESAEVLAVAPRKPKKSPKK
jgi:hypothetical protein